MCFSKSRYPLRYSKSLEFEILNVDGFRLVSEFKFWVHIFGRFVEVTTCNRQKTQLAIEQFFAYKYFVIHGFWKENYKLIDSSLDMIDTVRVSAANLMV